MSAVREKMAHGGRDDASRPQGLLILFAVCLGGEGEPLALLSMPVRLLRRLTGTALRAAFRSRSAVDARKAPASPTGTALRAAFRSPPARERVSLPPKPPIPSPARFYQGKKLGQGAYRPSG